MRNFWSSFFAALLAFVVGGIITFCVAVFVFFASIAFVIGDINGKNTSQSLGKESVLLLDLNKITDSPQPFSPFDFLSSKSNGSYSLPVILKSIESAKNDSHIKGIYLKNMMPVGAGMASLKEIRKSLESFKKGGKWVISYADSYTQGGYYLSSVANDLYLNPLGVIELNGLSSRSLFYRDMLKKLGVEMMVFKVGTYKGAVEPYILDRYSEANKEQISSYMNGLWQELGGAVSEKMNISTDSLDRIVDECPAMFPQQKYVDLNMVKALAYEREVDNKIAKKLGLKDKEKIKFVSPMDLTKNKLDIQMKNKNAVAVFYAEGPIKPSAGYSGTPQISEKATSSLIDLAEDKNIKAVVLRVNSPGGSAYISEQIWDAVKYIKSKNKPVVVSMGDYAASGGYYISSAADYIYAEPVTITGSIGIFGLFPNLAGLAQKAELKTDEVKTHKHAGIYSNLFSALTEEEKALMQANLERGYDTFISRVSEGRKITKEQVDEIGQGRVWTGKQALDRRLVDGIGDLNSAIGKAAQLANLNQYSIKHVTEEKEMPVNLLSFLPFKFLQSSFIAKILGWENNTSLLKEMEEVQDRPLTEFNQAILPYEIKI